MLITVFGLYSCSEQQEKSTVEPTSANQPITLNSEQIKNAGITFGEPSFVKMGSIIQVTGSVEVPPQNKTAIGFPFGGIVSSIKVLDGMNVTKGQVLLTIEDPALIQLQEDYFDAKSQLEFLQQDYDRQKSLSDQQVNSSKTLQQAKSSYFSMLGRCKGLKLKLEMAGLSPESIAAGNLVKAVSIRAPFNGIITKMTASVGHYVSPQETVLEIIDLKHCHVELFVFEKDIPQLKIGQDVSLTFPDGGPAKKGKLFLIGRDIGADRMIKVHCHLNEENEQLIPGSFVNAKITADPSNQMTVPSEAVGKLEGKDVVFWPTSTRGKETFFEAKPIEILREENDLISFRYVKKEDTKHSLVLTGAYSIVSSILLKTQPAEE